MKALTVEDVLNEMSIEDETPRFTNIPPDLSKRYHFDEKGKITGRIDTKEIVKERKRAEARKRIELSAIFRAKFPTTLKGITDLETWANLHGEPGDYVLRPIDLPVEGEGEIVVYDDESGLGTEITRDLRSDYAASAEKGNYFNVSAIKLDKWLELDSDRKMRSRMDHHETTAEMVPDIIGKMD